MPAGMLAITFYPLKTGNVSAISGLTLNPQHLELPFINHHVLTMQSRLQTIAIVAYKQ